MTANVSVKVLVILDVVVTRLPLIAVTHVRVLVTAVWVQLNATCGISFTLHNQCLVVFHEGFSSTIRRTQNCSDSHWNYWDCLIWLRLAWPDIALGDIKRELVFWFFLSVNTFRYRLWGLIRMIEIIFIYDIPRREVSEQGKYVYNILCILFCSTVWEKKCKNSANCVQAISCTSICRNAQHLIWAMRVSFVIKNKGSCEKLVFLMFY